MFITLLAKNTPDFKTFLERNKLTRKILSSSDSKSLAKTLSEFAKEKLGKDGLTEEFKKFIINVYKNQNLFSFRKNITTFPLFNRALDPVSLSLIEHHLFHFEPESSDSKEHDLETLISSYNEIFNKIQLAIIVKSTTALNNPMVVYDYSDAKSPITDDSQLLIDLAKQLDKIESPHLLKGLLFTGGHGAQQFLNNLPQESIARVVCLFNKKKIKFESIAIDCCFGAMHFEEFNSILSPTGKLIANSDESKAHTILDALQQNDVSESEFKHAIEKSLIYNTGLVLYGKETKNVYSLKPEPPKDERFKKYLKKSALVEKPTSNQEMMKHLYLPLRLFSASRSPSTSDSEDSKAIEPTKGLSSYIPRPK